MALVGQQFGDWEVISEPFIIRQKQGYVVKARCKCGNEGIRTLSVLRRGKLTHCVKCNKGKTGSFRPEIKLDPLEASARGAYKRTKYNALRKGREFSFSYEEWYTLTQLPCHYCGAIGSNQTTRHDYKHNAFGVPFVYNGLDRVDSSGGYTKNNVVTCCDTCNVAKSIMSVNDFLGWIKRVYEHSVQL